MFLPLLQQEDDGEESATQNHGQAQNQEGHLPCYTLKDNYASTSSNEPSQIKSTSYGGTYQSHCLN